MCGRQLANAESLSDHVKKHELGAKFRELRHAAAFSQEELAAKAAIDRSSLQRIEGGEVSPTMETAWAIAAAMNRGIRIQEKGFPAGEPVNTISLVALLESVGRS